MTVDTKRPPSPRRGGPQFLPRWQRLRRPLSLRWTSSAGHHGTVRIIDAAGRRAASGRRRAQDLGRRVERHRRRRHRLPNGSYLTGSTAATAPATCASSTRRSCSTTRSSSTLVRHELRPTGGQTSRLTVTLRRSATVTARSTRARPRSARSGRARRLRPGVSLDVVRQDEQRRVRQGRQVPRPGRRRVATARRTGPAPHGPGPLSRGAALHWRP